MQLKNLAPLAFSAILATPASYNPQNGIVEYEAEPLDGGETCLWVAAVYGALVTCQMGWVMTGVCGSGYRSDCDNGKYWYMIKCCEAGLDYPQHDCEMEHSRYGSSCSCGGDRVAFGGCGSGKNADCKNSGHKDWNELQCCKKDNLRVDKNGCLEFYGNHGGKIECPQHYAITRVCGSGMWEDCSGKTTKAQCCSYELK